MIYVLIIGAPVFLAAIIAYCVGLSVGEDMQKAKDKKRWDEHYAEQDKYRQQLPVGWDIKTYQSKKTYTKHDQWGINRGKENYITVEIFDTLNPEHAYLQNIEILTPDAVKKARKELIELYLAEQGEL